MQRQLIQYWCRHSWSKMRKNVTATIPEDIADPIIFCERYTLPDQGAYISTHGESLVDILAPRRFRLELERLNQVIWAKRNSFASLINLANAPGCLINGHITLFKLWFTPHVVQNWSTEPLKHFFDFSARKRIKLQRTQRPVYILFSLIGNLQEGLQNDIAGHVMYWLRQNCPRAYDAELHNLMESQLNNPISFLPKSATHIAIIWWQLFDLLKQAPSNLHSTCNPKHTR